MTALIIIAAIVVLLLVLLFSPAVLNFHYDDGDLKLKLRYLLFSLNLSPEALTKREKKKVRRKKPEKKPQASEAPETKKKAKKKSAVTPQDIWVLLKASRRALNTIRWNLILYKINVTVVVGGPDAHTIGEKYAAYGILIPDLINLLDHMFTTVEPQVLIMPNFLREKTYWNIAFKARIAPWHVLAAGCHMLLQFVKSSLKRKQKREKIKGGKKHEPTASHK